MKNSTKSRGAAVRLARFVSAVVGVGALAASVGFAYFQIALPHHYELPTISLPTDAKRLENGRYLAQHVALCVECHSVHDGKRYARPIDSQTLGRGGEEFKGSFGVLRAPNITPTGIGQWSDEDLYRTVVTGVCPDKRTLFPLMPYPNYGRVDQRDVEDILAYIRSLPASGAEVPASELKFPLSVLVRTMGMAPAREQRPDPMDGLKYGAYLTTMASCADCHTPRDKGTPIAGMEFAGGAEFPLDSGLARSANITPDKTTGIGSWSRGMFIARFKNLKALHFSDAELAAGAPNTNMPWRSYAGMTDQDLGAIYDYLHSLVPVSHHVDPFEGQPGTLPASGA